MKLKFVVVDYNDVGHIFSVLNGCDYCRLHYENEFIIDCHKEHNHRYSFKAFFYNSKSIYSYCYYDTKAKLFSAIQFVLKQELYDVRQF